MNNVAFGAGKTGKFFFILVQPKQKPDFNKSVLSIGAAFDPITYLTRPQVILRIICWVSSRD